MATNSQSSQQRLDELNPILNDLESAFTTRFSGWADNDHQSPAHYFERVYADTIKVIYSIGEEEFEKNKPDKSLTSEFGELFKRALRLLRFAEEFVTEAAEDIKNGGSGLRPVHKMLLADWVRLSQRSNIRGSNGTNGIGRHLTHMIIGVLQHEPPVEDSWTEDKSDIKPDPEFDTAYFKFLDLEHRMPRKRQGQIELYARVSWLQLNLALRALGLPEHLAEPPDNFFQNEVRPTYVDYPCGSDEFLYGKGKRQGILAVKQMLGGPLTEGEKVKIRIASQKRVDTRPPEQPKDSKRPRLSSGTSGTLSGPVAKYMAYDQINAAADLEDSLREGSHQVHKPLARPNDQRLVLPTHPNRAEILAIYGPRLRSIVNSQFKTRFSLSNLDEKLPRVASERNAWLKAAEEEINLERATIKSKIVKISSPTAAKELRIAAFKLKLARSLYMVGLLSGTPAVSARVRKAALQDRLSDWILYEEAWNASDVHLLSRSRLTEEKQAAINEDINERKTNIGRWNRFLQQLGGGNNNNSSGVDLGNDDDDDDGNYAAREEGFKDGVPWLTEEQIETAEGILMGVLNPRLPDRGDYLLDKRSERRRREWFDKMAVAKLTGEPVPAWTHKKVVDPFTAGGPPDYETLPRETVWDRLQYMWVLTFWRFYQLRHLEL